MPFKFETEKKRIPKSKDRRRKLTPKIKKKILELHHSGMSQNKIAKHFEIDRKTVRYTINPEYYEEMLESAKIRRADGRYKPNKDDWAATMREHRAYKQSIKSSLI